VVAQNLFSTFLKTSRGAAEMSGNKVFI